jgi:uncharacterized OB-fold protein
VRGAHLQEGKVMNCELWKRGKVACWECAKCGLRSGVAVTFCPGCGSNHIKTLDFDARGTIISLALITVPEERFSNAVPYGYCIVQGDGFTFTGWCEGSDAERLKTGSKVKGVSHDGDGLKIEPI